MTNNSQLNNMRFTLNQQKGITNIGSHPDNDIVISDPRVLPFHLIVDNRQKPYKIIALQPNSNITVQGVSVASGAPIEVKDLDQVQFNGFQFHMQPGVNDADNLEILSPRAGASVPLQAMEPSPSFSDEDLAAPSQGSPEAFIPAQGKYPMQIPPAHPDDIILVHLAAEPQTINVDQTVVYTATVVNGGPIVATFDPSVVGVPETWVSVVPRKLNLNEGGRGQVEIRITPPHDPSSLAASYPIQLNVSSANYPDHIGQANTSVVVNPFFQYSVGNLEPRNQSVSWSKRAGMVHFPISNMGNSLAAYQVTATDDENGLRFEFPQEDQTSLTRQSEVRIEPGAVKTVPVIVNPLKRSIFRLRKKNYNYNVRTQPLGDETAAQMVSGSFASMPLFGFLTLLLMMLLIMVLGYFLMKPRIIEFAAAKEIIELGQPATLRWKVSFFTNDINIEGVSEKIQGRQNQVHVVPNNTVSTYTLVASNWLSRLLRLPDLRSEPVTVLMIPSSPAITTFTVNKRDAFVGDTVNVKWSIANGDKAFLTVDRVTDTLDKDKFNGERPITIARDTLVVLEVQNSSGKLIRSEFIKAREPAIKIEEFTLSNTTITVGDPVTIKWKVSGDGVETVNISPFKDPLPLKGEMTFFPKESMEFIMSVKNRDLEEIRILPVGVLPPGTPPEPPKINFFKAAPPKMVGSGSSEFSWSISGVTDKIEITDSKGIVAGKLPAQGFIGVNVSKTTNYILTAYNKTASAAQSLEVTVEPALMNTLVQINSILPSTAIFRGDPLQVYFSVDPFIDGKVVKDVIGANLPEVSGKVIVTDGFDTCEATLPQTSCILKLNTTGKDKKLTATYSGDSAYARRTSEPYPGDGSLNILGTPAKFVSVAISPKTEIFVGQPVNVQMVLGPVDPAKSGAVTGDIGIWEIVKGVEAAEPLCKMSLQGVEGQANQGTATCSLSFNTAGTKILRLKYFGNNMYDGVILNVPDVPSIVLQPVATDTIITTNLSSATVTGQAIDIAVLVKAKQSANITPTGTVHIYDVSNTSGGCYIRLTNGVGSCPLSFTTATVADIKDNVIAIFSPGDANSLNSQSLSSHPVNKAATSIEIDRTSLPALSVGQNLLIPFTVKPISPGVGRITGKVIVYWGATEFCTLSDIGGENGSCMGTLTDANSKDFIAKYVGDSNFLNSDSGGVPYKATRADTTTLIQSAIVDPTDSKTFTVSVNVSTLPASSTSVIGKVIVSTTESTNACELSYPTQKECNITFTTEGAKDIWAKFENTNDFVTSTSAATNVFVKRRSSVITISSNPANSTGVSVPVVFSVIVKPYTTGTEKPTGTVTIKSTNNDICTTQLIDTTTGEGNCKITFTTMGSKSITATYDGDSIFSSSNSATLTLNVTPADTTTTATPDSTTNLAIGDKITVSVAVKAIQPASPAPAITLIPGGTVSVSASSNENEKCNPDVSLSNGTGSCEITFAVEGNKTILAKYIPTLSPQTFNTSSDQSTTFSVSKAESETQVPALTSVVTGQTITVNYLVQPVKNLSFKPTSAVVTVKAYQTINNVETEVASCPANTTGDYFDADGKGSCSLKITHVGDYIIKASYAGDTKFKPSTSTGTPIKVNAANTEVEIIKPSSLATSVEGDFTLKVKPISPSTGIPAGEIKFSATKDFLSISNTCPAPSSGNNLINGQVTCKMAFPIAGEWNLTAEYKSSNNDYNNSTTTGDSITIIKADPTLSLTTGKLIIDQDITLTASVENSVTTSTKPTGSITFKAKSPSESTATTRCTVDLSSGQTSAECTFTPDSYGLWNFSAEYSGDDNFNSKIITLKDKKVTGIGYILALAGDNTTYVDLQKSYTVTFQSDSTTTPAKKIYFSATLGTTSKNFCTQGIDLVVDSVDTKKFKATCNSIKLDATGTWTVKASYPSSDSNYETGEVTLSVTSGKYTPVLTLDSAEHKFVKLNNNNQYEPIADLFSYSGTESIGSTFSFTLTTTPTPLSDPTGTVNLSAEYYSYNSGTYNSTGENKTGQCDYSLIKNCQLILPQKNTVGKWLVATKFVSTNTNYSNSNQIDFTFYTSNITGGLLATDPNNSNNYYGQASVSTLPDPSVVNSVMTLSLPLLESNNTKHVYSLNYTTPGVATPPTIWFEKSFGKFELATGWPKYVFFLGKSDLLPMVGSVTKEDPKP